MKKIIICLIFLLFVKEVYSLASQLDQNKNETSRDNQNTNLPIVQYIQSVPSHNKPISLDLLNSIKQINLQQSKNDTASDIKYPQKGFVNNSQIQDQQLVNIAAKQIQVKQSTQQQSNPISQINVIKTIQNAKVQKIQKQTVNKNTNLSQNLNTQRVNQTTAQQNKMVSSNLKADIIQAKNPNDGAQNQQKTKTAPQQFTKQINPIRNTVSDTNNMPEVPKVNQIKQSQQIKIKQLINKNTQFVKTQTTNLRPDSGKQTKSLIEQIQKKTNDIKKSQQIIDVMKKEQQTTTLPPQISKQLSEKNLVNTNQNAQDNIKQNKETLNSKVIQPKKQQIQATIINDQSKPSENDPQKVIQQPIKQSQQAIVKTPPQIKIIPLQQQQQNEPEIINDDLKIKQKQNILSSQNKKQQQIITSQQLKQQQITIKNIQNNKIENINKIQKIQQFKKQQQKHQTLQINPTPISNQLNNVNQKVQIIQKQDIRSQIQQQKQIAQQKPIQLEIKKQKIIEVVQQPKNKEMAQKVQQQLQSKEQIQILLKEIVTQLNQNTKIKIIKHLQNDLKLKNQQTNSINKEDNSKQNGDNTNLMVQSIQISKQISSKDQNMDTTTIIVLLLLTFIISIPIVRQIRIKTNRNANSLNENYSQNSLDQTNDKKQAQFYKERDVNQTGLGICQTQYI